MNTINTASAIATIDKLDLGAIKIKLMHVASGEGWSAGHADAVEVEYRRFLTLMKLYPTDSTAPLVDVDTFWHYHILDTAKYAADCEQAFGYFLHHYPYLGMDGTEDVGVRDLAGARMAELYSATFGASMDAAPAAWYGAAAPQAQLARAWCGAATAQSAVAWCGAAAPAAAAVTAWCGAAAQQPPRPHGVAPPRRSRPPHGVAPPRRNKLPHGVAPPRRSRPPHGVAPPRRSRPPHGVAPPGRSACRSATTSP